LDNHSNEPDSHYYALKNVGPNDCFQSTERGVEGAHNPSYNYQKPQVQTGNCETNQIDDFVIFWAIFMKKPLTN